MTNKPEKITGTLDCNNGKWRVRSGYGIFPLASALQGKPDPNTAPGADVEATVLHGQVTEYNFTKPFSDGGEVREGLI